MGSAVAWHTTGREARLPRFEAGHSPAVARVLVASRLEAPSRRLWQVVGVRLQANAVVAGSSGRSVRGDPGRRSSRQPLP